MGPSSFHHLCRVRQESKASRRARRCLLKGCERWFIPSRPQVQFCTEGCSREAGEWRRWHAEQRYRASEQGRQRRREQSQRYRERRRRRQAEAGRSALAEAVPSPETAPCPPPETMPPPETVPCDGERPAVDVTESLPREGERPALKCGDFQLLPCDRPGCYELVVGRYEDKRRHFCSSLCRLALRRVIDREKRYQRRLERRRDGIRPRRLDTS